MAKNLQFNRLSNPVSKYKLIISISMGLIGFLGSFFAIKFSYGDVDIIINWSLVFPVLVALAWGRRYGQISVCLGLAVFYPFLLGRYNGWACFVTSFMLLSWVTIIGWGRDKRLSEKKFYSNTYFLQLVYSALRVALYFTAFPLLFMLNPPFWYPAANTSIAFSTLTVFAVKSFIIDFMILSIADVLLLIPFVRRLLKLDCPKYMRRNAGIILLIFILVLFFEEITLSSDYFLVHKDYSFRWLIDLSPADLTYLMWAAFAGIIVSGIIIKIFNKRLETKESMEKGEKKYRDIFNNFNDIYIETDAGRIIRTISPSVERILGYKPEMLIGIEVSSLLFEPEAIERLAEHLRLYKTIGNIHMAIKDIAHIKHDFLLNVERTESETGEVRFVVIARDVTLYFEAEDKLKLAEKKYSMLFNSMINAMIIIEPVYDENDKLIDFRYIDANTAYENFSGRQLHEVLGRTFFEVHGIRDCYLETYEKVFKTGEPQRFIGHHPQKNEIFDLVHAFKFGNNQAALLFDDITDRVQMEKELKRVSDNLTAIIESTDDLIWSVDRNFAIVQFNTALSRYVMESDGSEVRPGMQMHELMEEKRVTFWTGLYERAVREGKYRVDIPTKYGDKFYSVSLYPIHKNGEISVISVFAKDISHRLRMEQELIRLNEELEARVDERTEALQHALSELESFTFTVSHDLKSPLRTIEAYSTILLEDNPQLDGGDIGQTTRQIKNISSDMLTFTDKLLQYSTASRFEPYREKLDLFELICSIFTDLTRTEADRQIELIIKDDIPCIYADKVMMRQILTNILTNAVKFTKKQSRAEITMTCAIDDVEMTLCIRDNGIGFDPASTDKLFKIFQRLHAKDEYEGTGIGLATVRKLIQNHGGSVWIEGKPGEGAAVYITLPASYVLGGTNV